MDKAKEIRGELIVEVFKVNSIGRAFYAKYGFEIVAEKVTNKPDSICCVCGCRVHSTEG